MNNTSDSNKQQLHKIIIALPLRDDGKIWTDKVTFTASKPIEVGVLHSYDPNIIIDSQQHGEPYNSVILPQNKSFAILIKKLYWT